MDHLAIMKKSLKLIPKIFSGQKTIESRWYMAKFAPWNRIEKGDTVYFKDCGEAVTAKAEVENVMQFENFTTNELTDIIQKYGGGGKICFWSSPEEVFDWAKNKKYCVLIFLKNPQKVEPFEIDKTGFGNACAWLSIENINDIKK